MKHLCVTVMLRILCFIALFAGLVLNAYADVIPDGHHSVEHCFRVSNMSKYSDYTFISRSFLVNFADSNWVNSVIVMDSCNGFNRGVKKLQICTTKEKVDLQNFHTNKTICSNILEIQFAGFIRNGEPIQKIIDVLEVDKPTDAELYIKKLKMVYYYNDGTSEELSYKTQDVRPLPSKKSISIISSKLWFMLPVGVFLAILLITIQKYHKRKIA